MRTKQFDVPVELIREFSEIIERHELFAKLQGVTEDGELMVEVDYETTEQGAGVMELIDTIDDYSAGDE